MSASQVRNPHFRSARHGLAPDEVYTFLHLVADELAAAQHELRWVREENTRIKSTLRDWKTRFTTGARA